MRVSEAMVRADGLRMNTVSEEQKAAWLYELEGQLAEMMRVPVPPFRWPEEDRKLLLPPPHEEVYSLYLVCKIDYYNQEMDLYANDRAMYDGALAEARGWWRRHHRPKGKGNWRV